MSKSVCYLAVTVTKRNLEKGYLKRFFNANIYITIHIYITTKCVIVDIRYPAIETTAKKEYSQIKVVG